MRQISTREQLTHVLKLKVNVRPSKTPDMTKCNCFTDRIMNKKQILYKETNDNH